MRCTTTLAAMFLHGAAAVACSTSSYVAPAADAAPPHDAPIADAAPGARCASEHPGTTADGDAVIVCDAPFPARPFVHLPPDDAATIYAAVTPHLEAIDRAGERYALVDAAGKPLLQRGDLFGDPPVQRGPPGLRMMSNRYLYVVYRITGAVTGDSMRLDSATPYVLLSGRALDGAMLGAWEGTASRRLGEGKFDDAARVPIRVKLHELASQGQLPVWGYSATRLADGEYFSATGEIENWDKPARAADGTCLPALNAMGDNNPFLGTNGAVRLTRAPSMHAPGDDMIVLDPVTPAPAAGMLGMGTNAGFVTPAAFLRAIVPADFTEISLVPHGTPTGMRVELAGVGGGGGGC